MGTQTDLIEDTAESEKFSGKFEGKTKGKSSSRRRRHSFKKHLSKKHGKKHHFHHLVKQIKKHLKKHGKKHGKVRHPFLHKIVKKLKKQGKTHHKHHHHHIHHLVKQIKKHLSKKHGKKKHFLHHIVHKVKKPGKKEGSDPLSMHSEKMTKVAARCKLSHTNLRRAQRAIGAHSAAIKRAEKLEKKTCDKEKKQEKKSKAAKKKMRVTGPTFKFPVGQPCKKGKGSFSMKLKLNQRVNVGVIPANMPNVWVKLRTDKDVDAELWAHDGKREIAIVAWRVGKIDSPTAASIKYAGGLIKYSGHNGIKSKNGALNFGHEDIQIVGKAKVPFEMRAFAFEAGVAHITYSWGADPAKCKAQKAALRKEKRAKHHAKLAMRKKMSESKYKAALMVLQGKIKGCKGAKKWTTTSRNELKKALALMRGHGTKLKICRNTQESLHKKHVILVKQEKAAKERLKKERSRKEKAAKETKVKEKKSKEARHKELKLKEKSIKEKKTKELKGKEKRKKAK